MAHTSINMAGFSSGVHPSGRRSVYYTPSVRAERMVAIGRFLLAVVSLVAVWIDPTSPMKYASTTYTILAAYAVYALGIAIVVFSNVSRGLQIRLATHLIDLVFFSGVIYLTEGATSPFFLFFVFALVSAGLRFRTRGTALTAAAALAIFLGMGIYASFVLRDPDAEISRFLVRSVYLAIMSVLLIYLGRFQERYRRELSLLASWPRSVPESREQVFEELLKAARELLHARTVVLILEDRSTHAMSTAYLDNGEVREESPNAVDLAIDASLENMDFLCRDIREQEPSVVCLTPWGFVTKRGTRIPTAYLSRFGAGSMISIQVRGQSVRGRMVAIGIADVSEDVLVLGRVVAEMIALRVDELYYLERVTEAAVGDERIRVSRELHDGLLQSLTAVALQLRIAEGVLGRDPDRAIDILSRLRRAIMDDQRDLRRFVSNLRYEQQPTSTHSVLGMRLAAIVDRFRMTWGVEIALDLEALDDTIPEAILGDAVKIAQEGLSNACRHSGASQVRLRVRQENHALRISIEDDGHGFPFRGRFDLRTLDVEEIGPLTLRERIGALGGDLVVTSGDNGSTVDATIPIVADEADGKTTERGAWLTS